MNYIAIDCHISTLEFAVVNESGKIVERKTVPTSVKTLMEFVRSIPKPRKIIIEEGSLSGWVSETCDQYKEELIVSDPKTNRWICSSGEKRDPLDALKLAQLARGGYLKEIYHSVGERRRFRELVLAYHDTVRNETRIKNKLKAKFRQNGINCTGQTVYNKTYREEWLNKLPKVPIVHIIINGLWNQLDEIDKNRDNILRTIKSESKKYAEIKNFKEVPGVGPVIAATISGILETPHRFANKRKVWMYAGLGIVERSSGEKVYSKKLSKNYNRILKCAIKQAAESAVMSKDNIFRQHYLKMTIENGIPSHRAKLTVARSMLAALYGMWKKGEKFNPKINVKKIETEQIGLSMAA